MTGSLLNSFPLPIAFCFRKWSAKAAAAEGVRPGSPAATVLDGQAISPCCVSPPNQTLPLICLPTTLCMQAFIKGAWQSSVSFTLCCFGSRSGALPTARQLEAWLLQSDSINKPLNWRRCLEAARRDRACWVPSGCQSATAEKKAAEGRLFITRIWILFCKRRGRMKREFHEQTVLFRSKKKKQKKKRSQWLQNEEKLRVETKSLAAGSIIMLRCMLNTISSGTVCYIWFICDFHMNKLLFKAWTKLCTCCTTFCYLFPRRKPPQFHGMEGCCCRKLMKK